MISSITRQIRIWLDLLNESYFDPLFFSESDYDSLDQFGYPIRGIIETLNDSDTTPQERSDIRNFLEVLLSDGGLWGESLNAHDISTTRLKSKIIALVNSVK